MNSPACRTLLVSALLCIPLLGSCSSLHLELCRIGIVAVPSNASSITGTFSNASHGRQITLHLWDMVHEPPTKSLQTDRVVISRAGFSRIQMRLLRNGKVLDQRTLPFSPRDNHLHLSTRRTFKLLPFGFGGSRESLGLSSTREGELVVVSHTSSYGVILFYSAGDGSTTAHRFARLPDFTGS